MFNGHSIGSGFTKFGYENDKYICLNVEIFDKIQ